MAKGKANEKIDAAAVEETSAPEQSQAGGEAGNSAGSDTQLASNPDRSDVAEEHVSIQGTARDQEEVHPKHAPNGAPMENPQPEETGMDDASGSLSDQAPQVPEGNSSNGAPVENAQPEEVGQGYDTASLNNQAQPEPEFSFETLTRIEKAQIGAFQWVLDECASVFAALEIDMDRDLLPHVHGDFIPNVPRAQRILALNQLVERIGHVHATPAVLAQQLKLDGVFKPEHELQQKAAEAALSAFIEMRRVVTDFADRARFWKEAHVAALVPPPAPLPLEDTALELVDAPGASF